MRRKRKNKFPKIAGKVRLNEPLSRHSTFGIGGNCRIWVEPSGEDDLREILRFAKIKRKKVFIVGSGSNILFGDKGFDGIMVHLGGRGFKEVRFRGSRLTAGAGVRLGYLIARACKKGLGGLEGLVGIPGTLGGAIFMNCGYRKNISEPLEEIEAMDMISGKIKIIKKKNIEFGYRHSGLNNYIILGATLKLKKEKRRLLQKRKEIFMAMKKSEQPLEFRSAGCVFKNPNRKFTAARYIEMAGLKGKRIGGAAISAKHANFIVNLKNAKAKDVRRLVGLTRRRVRSRFKVNLVLEIATV